MLIDRSDLWKGRPVKALTEGLTSQGGRNNTGRITMRRRGGGVKRLYRIVDFKRIKDGVPAKVAAVEYDPNRNCRILLLHYHDGEKAYVLAPRGVKVGDRLQSGQGSDIRPGNALPLRFIPVGTTVHNVELKPGQGGRMVYGLRGGVVGAPHLKTEHYPVFDCAIGERAIHYMGHVKMMGAVQPFISGAISKTVNLPEQTTIDEIAQLLVESWQLGVKAIAIYRDNCKVAQPLSGSGSDKAAALLPAGATGAAAAVTELE